jgi:hypothetical protein
MIPQANQNAAGSKITVTATATNIFSLINTAAGTTLGRAGFVNDTDSIDIMAEDGDIRVLYDGNTPTSANGELIKQGIVKRYRGISLVDMKLIRVTGDTVCSIVLGKSKPGEGGGTDLGSASFTADTEFPAAAALADNIILPTTTEVGAVMQGYDGTNLDLVRVGQTGNAAAVTGFLNDLPMARYNATPTARTEGQFGNLQSDANGALSVNIAGGSSGMADDSAFTVGTSTVTPAGFIADDTATDSVDEGDVGAARMTLDRKQITAGDYVDDAAFTPAATTSYVHVMGAQADETSPDSVDEGDAGALRMTLTRFLKTSGGDLSAGEDLTNNVLAVQIKPLASTSYSPSTYTNLGTAATANIKASTGNVFSISIINTNVATRYFQLFNSTSSTATVVYCWTIPAGGALIVGNDFFTNAGINFSTGITWGVSTTFLTYTAATAAEHVTAVNYI